MRLICPNCDAQYEVDAGMIPASGRDVQCSNCGHTWFQSPDQEDRPSLIVQSEETSQQAREGKSGAGLDETAAAFFEGRDAPEPADVHEDAPQDDYEDEDVDVTESPPVAFEEEPQPETPVEDEPAADDRVAAEETHETTGDYIEATQQVEDAAEPEPKPVVEEVHAEAAPEEDHAVTPVVSEDSDEEERRLRRAIAEADGREPEGAVTAEEPSHVDEPEVAEPDVAQHVDMEVASHEEADDDDEAPRSDLPRKEVDSNVLGILRAEAEREIAQRRAEEAGLVETQPDLGLSEPAADDDETVAARTARLRGEGEHRASDVHRKEMLPDIDDINASLTATSDRPPAEGAPIPVDTVLRRRAGFRLGFAAMIVLAIGLILVYLNAPELAAAMPQFEPALASYVEWANAMRQGLDGLLMSSVETLSRIGPDDQ